MTYGNKEPGSFGDAIDDILRMPIGAADIPAQAWAYVPTPGEAVAAAAACGSYGQACKTGEFVGRALRGEVSDDEVALLESSRERVRYAERTRTSPKPMEPGENRAEPYNFDHFT